MKRLGRIVALVLLVFLCAILIPLVNVVAECRPWAAVNSTQSENAVSPAVAQIRAGLTDYPRPEDQTYLTLPEWYIVYSADEYATYVAENPPSGFPYFGAIGQYWRSYYSVCAITRERYPFNSDYQLTLAVIGTSFMVENIFKGLYENTVGRLTEWLSSPELTEEDAYAREVAQAYGDFIHTIPWYEFPFDQKLSGLWQNTSLTGPNFIRKWERKLALSLEYGGKAGYAWLIKQGTQTAYAPEKLEIQVWVEGVPDEVWQNEPQLRLVKTIGPGEAIVAIPRYEAFTQMVPRLVRQGLRFVEIAGNDEILLTALVPRTWEYRQEAGLFLFSMDILSQPGVKRIAVKVPVSSLPTVLTGLESSGAKLEHLYDY